MNISRIAAMASLLSLPVAAGAASPLALSCTGCHQPLVNAPEMPALNRQSAAHIAAWLRNSRDNPEPGSIMARFAKTLTDGEIDRLAAELGGR